MYNARQSVGYPLDIWGGILMELNLHIIAEDLKYLDVKTRIESDHLERTLKYAAFWDPEVPLRPEVLGVIKAGDIDKITLRRVGRNVAATYSIFCVGEPNLELLPAHCDIVWV